MTMETDSPHELCSAVLILFVKS